MNQLKIMADIYNFWSIYKVFKVYTWNFLIEHRVKKNFILFTLLNKYYFSYVLIYEFNSDLIHLHVLYK